MKSLKIIIACVVCCLCLTACGIKTVDYKSTDYGNTKAQLVEQIGSEPNEVSKAEDGTEQYIYKKSKYLDYTGTMTYYSVDDSILFSRWELSEKDTGKADTIYDTIVNNVKSQFSQKGEETSTENSHSIAFSESGNTTTVSYLEEADGIKISITNTNQEQTK